MSDAFNNSEVIPPSGIKTIILIDKEIGFDEFKPIMAAISDLNILIQKSGYLFTSSIKGDSLCIGLLPYFIDGQRTHHYDIDLSVRGKCVLVGFVNSNETIAIYFKPSEDTYNGAFLPGIADVFCDNYIRLARFFFENGFSKNFDLDAGTKSILSETALFAEIPATLKELASFPAPYDTTV